MNNVLFKITSIYHINDRDWMNFEICKDNPLTYHHILEKRNGGKKRVNNGAPLTKYAHEYLNMIEVKDNRLYIILNTIFKIVHNENIPMTKEQRAIIDEVLTYFENNIETYKNPKNNNQKLLEKYVKYKR